MNPLKEVFALGQAIGWIETQNTIAFLRPVTRPGSCSAPGPTAGLAHLLGLGQICFPAPELLGEKLVFSNIHPGPKEALKNLTLRDRNTYTPYVTTLSVGPHNSFCKIESKMVIQHLGDALFHEGAIFRVHKSQVFFNCGRRVTRIKAVNLE